MPLAIYDRFATDFDGALALSAVLVIVAAAMLLAVKLVGAAPRSPMLELAAPPGSATLELDAELAVPSRPVPGPGRAVGRRQDQRPARRWPGCCAPAGPGGLRRADVARHRGRRRPAARAAPLWATCSRTTRCSRHLSAWRNVAFAVERAARPSGAAAPSSCSSASGWAAVRRRRRASSPAASASAWPSPGRWPASPSVCCSTSRCRRSTRARAPRAVRELARRPGRGRGADADGDPRLRRGGAARRPRSGSSTPGRVVQRGSASELAAAPASAFVADFTGAVVLTGTAGAPRAALTTVDAGRRRRGRQHRPRRGRR